MTYSYTEIHDRIALEENLSKRAAEQLKRINKMTQFNLAIEDADGDMSGYTEDIKTELNKLTAHYEHQLSECKANLAKYKKMLRLIDELDKLNNDQ